MKMSETVTKTPQDPRLNWVNWDTLLFTNVAVSLETRIGRADVNHVTSEQLCAMNLMFTHNGGNTAELDGLLVMRQFTDRVMGDECTKDILNELATINECENPLHPLFFADYEEDSSFRTHKVHALHKHPSVQRARNMAAMWTMQDHPLVAQTGGVLHTHLLGRGVHWHMCLRTCQLPWKGGSVVLHPGDVYVKAVL